MAKRQNTDEEVETSNLEIFPDDAPVETEVNEFPSGLRVKMNKPKAKEDWYELPCGATVVKRRGSGEDMVRIVRMAGGKQERVNDLLIHYLVEIINEDGNREKMTVEDIRQFDLENYLALCDLVNIEKKAVPIPAPI